MWSISLRLVHDLAGCPKLGTTKAKFIPLLSDLCNIIRISQLKKSSIGVFVSSVHCLVSTVVVLKTIWHIELARLPKM